MCQRKSRKGSRGMGEENTEGEEKVQGWPWEAECKWGKSRGGLGHEIGHYLIHRVFLGRVCRKPCACRRELDGEPEGNQDLLALLVWIVATTSRPIHQPQFGATQTGEPTEHEASRLPITPSHHLQEGLPRWWAPPSLNFLPIQAGTDHSL